jgi:hypothetical protein
VKYMYYVCTKSVSGENNNLFQILFIVCEIYIIEWPTISRD